jgi:molecular chaperone HscB
MQNLFEIVGLPVAFTLDEKVLEQAYFAAQRQWHPDRFIGKPEAERLTAITRSQLVNDAYETLKSPLTRAEHLLELKGLTALSDEATVPQELLMEMMELREQVADAHDDGAELARLVRHIKADAADTIHALEEAFTTNDDPAALTETQRLNYLGKAMEEAHMLIYRLKAAHAHE